LPKLKEGESAISRPTRSGWLALAVGGLVLTLASFEIANLWAMATFESGPAIQFAVPGLLAMLAGYITSTVLIGRHVGVHRARQWVAAFLVVPTTLAVITIPTLVRFVVGGE
jgi:hypothetical protein